MDVLNNREISIAIWFALFLTVVLFNKKLRVPINSMLSIFLSRQILIPIGFMAVYVLSIIFLLSEVDLWRTDQIKNSIIWFFSVALVSLFKVDKEKENPHYFKNTLRNTFKVIVVIEFVVSVYYVFSLPVELIFVPFMVFVSLLVAVSSSKEEYKIVSVVLNKLLELIGVGVLIFTVYKLYSSFSEIYQVKALYDFIVPPLLTIFFLPFLYLFSVYLSYESVFVRLPIFIKDKEAVKYAKLMGFRRFLFKTNLLHRWFDSIVHNRVSNKGEVDSSINNIYTLLKREKSPKKIDKKEGWVPYDAMKFLKEESIETGYYKELYKNEWFASSQLKELSNKLFSNNVAYYVEGTIDTAKKLIIKLNINDLETEQDDVNYFILLLESIFRKAVGVELTDSIREFAINRETSTTEIVNNIRCCKIEREDNLNNKGYALKLIIKSI